MKSITLVLDPSRPVQDATGSCSQLLIGDYLQTATPTTAAQLLADERVKAYSTARPLRHTVTWARNPNAKLWTVTSSGISTANQYALVFGSPAAALLGNTLQIFTGYIEWEVELRGSQ